MVMPLIDWGGRGPVISTWIFPSFGFIYPTYPKRWLNSSCYIGRLIYLSISIVTNVYFNLSFLYLSHLRWRFMCPLYVAGAWSRKFFLTASAVKLGHVGNWLLSHALICVVFGLLIKHLCKNFISTFLEVVT